MVEGDAPGHLLVGVGHAAQAVDLGPAGDPGLDVVAARIERDLALELMVMGERMRARADQRHMPGDDVQELGRLVQIVAPQHAADPCDARIVRGRLDNDAAVIGGRHGAELEDAEGLLVEAVAALQEQDRAGRIEPDQRGDDQ